VLASCTIKKGLGQEYVNCKLYQYMIRFCVNIHK